MARAPTVPSISIPLVDKDGRLNREWYKYLTGEREYTTSVNSGVTLARAEAAAALTTGQAASQTAQAQSTNGFTLTANAEICSAASSDIGSQTTNSVTVTPSGGTAPYTYAWAFVDGDAGISINSPTSATTSFSGDPVGTALAATYRCTVTDSAGSPLTATFTIAVSIIYLGFG